MTSYPKNPIIGYPNGSTSYPKNLVISYPNGLTSYPQNPNIGYPPFWLVTPKNVKNQKKFDLFHFFPKSDEVLKDEVYD